MNSGIVALIGRPNTGKSTLVNAIIGRKVSITSPKPQTTRFPIQAVYEDQRGQIIFVDTPGIYEHAGDPLAKTLNQTATSELSKNIDIVIYLVDHTRQRSTEENRVLGILRKLSMPKIMVINKTDIVKPTHIVQYQFMKEEFSSVVEISALKRKNLPTLLHALFSRLPERDALIDLSEHPHPGLNVDSKQFIADLIREKAFLFLREEVPYSLTAVTDEITKRDNGTLYVKARILTTDDRYKKMIIGNHGAMIKEIGMATRKELELSRNNKVFLDLTVETDKHWLERME